MKHHYGWIIILLGALVVCATSCSGNKRKSFEVEVTSSDITGQTDYMVGVSTRDPYFNYQIISRYDPQSDATFGVMFTDRTEAILFAKRFVSIEVVKKWQDSVYSLVKNQPKPIQNERITIY